MPFPIERNIMFFKLIKQHDIRDCGAACLSMICTHYGLRLPMAVFRDLIKVDNNGASIYGVVDGASHVGLKAEALEGSPEELSDAVKKGEVTFPCIARVIMDDIYEHFVVICRMTNRRIYVADPAKGKVSYSLPDFFRIWTGHIIIFEKTDSFRKGNHQKGTLRKFVQLVTVQKKLLSGVFLVSLLITSISVAGAFLFQILIAGIENNSTDGFWGHSLMQVCLCVIGLYALQAALELLRGFFLTKLSMRVDLPLMTNFFCHTVELPVQRLDGRKTGELISRFADAASIRDAVSGATLSMLLDTFMVAVCFVVLFSLNVSLFAVTLLIVLAYAVVAAAFIKPTKTVNRSLMEKNEIVTSYLKEALDGVVTIKAFSAEETIEKTFAEKFRAFVGVNMRASVLFAGQSALSGFTASAGIVVLLWCGTALVLKGTLSLGVLLTFYSLLGYFLSPVQRLLDLQPQMQTAIVAAERLNDILDLETEPETEKSVLSGNDVMFDGVSFRYGNRELVLHDISLRIKSGETAAFIGESGSGKTTLVKLLMGFYVPEQGQVVIGDKSVTQLDAKALRQHMAYVSQDVFLFSDTIRQNLTLGNKDIPLESIRDACRKSGADSFIMRLPLGYNTLIGENGHDLSGGQKQRLALARALLKQPDILILDEATSHLDSLTERAIHDTISKLDKSITCIVIAHRLNTVKNCDRIFVMENGTITEQGTHASLLEQNGRYKQFYEQSL